MNAGFLRIFRIVCAAGLALSPLCAFGDLTFSYDDLNRLQKVSHEDSSFVEYTYDNVGNRLSKIAEDHSQYAAAINSLSVRFPAVDRAEVMVDLQLNHQSANLTLFWGGDELVSNSLPTQMVALSPYNQKVKFELNGLSAGQFVYFTVQAVNASSTTDTPIESFQVPIGLAVDLSVSFEGLIDTETTGSSQFDIKVENNSENTATGVRLDAVLRGVSEYSDLIPASGACQLLDSSRFSCELGDIAPRSSVSTAVESASSVAGWVSYLASVQSQNLELAPLDNHAVASIHFLPIDSDGDGLSDDIDPDDDNDGMDDSWELLHGLDPLDENDAGKDGDDDGYTNLEEFQAGSNPNDKESTPAPQLSCGWEFLNTQPSNNKLNAIAYHDGLAVVVGDRGFVMTSDDLGYWQVRNSQTERTLNWVGWFGDRFIAGGFGSDVVYSFDGKNWDDFGFSSVHWRPAYNGATLLFVDNKGNTFISQDQENWTVSSALEGKDIRALHWWNGNFYAISMEGEIHASSDGIGWSEVYATGGKELEEIFSNNSRLVVHTRENSILESVDGINWNEWLVSSKVEYVDAYASDGKLIIGVGGYTTAVNGSIHQIRSSTDGLWWTNVSQETHSELLDVIWTGEQFLAVGDDGMILSSNDGAQWTPLHERFLSVDLNDVINLGDDRYVAVGNGGTLLVSEDSFDWQPRNAPTTSNLHAVAYSGNTLVAVGDNGSIIHSADSGGSWNMRSGGTDKTLRSIVWAGDHFVASGGDNEQGALGEQIILSSIDGVSWSQSTFTLNGNVERLVYKDSVLLASTGSYFFEPNVYQSTDGGLTWETSFSGVLTDVMVLGDEFVLFSGSDVYKSQDGETWVQSGGGVVPGGNETVEFNGGLISVGGSLESYYQTNGVIGYSRNLTTWQTEPWIVHSPLSSVAAGLSTIVAVGTDGAILRDAKNCSDLSVDFESVDLMMEADTSAQIDVVVTNNGPIFATGVELDLELTKGFNIENARIGDNNCHLNSLEPNTVNCQLEGQGVDEQSVIQLTYSISNKNLVFPNNFSQSNYVLVAKARAESSSVFADARAEIVLKAFIKDFDGDGVAYPGDNCPAVANPDQRNFDGDPLGDACDPDDDNDGMSDAYEEQYGLNPNDDSDAGVDSDGDGFSNLEEFSGNTDPRDASSRPPLPLDYDFEWVNPLPQGDDLLAITHGNGYVVALPEIAGATVFYGDKWSQVSVPVRHQRDVLFAGDRFLIFGESVAISEDGLSWQNLSSLPDPVGERSQIETVWTGEMIYVLHNFYDTTYRTAVYSSNDGGMNWEIAFRLGSAGSNNMEITWGNDTLMAVSTSTYSRFWIKNDQGIKSSLPFPDLVVEGLAFLDGSFVAIGVDLCESCGSYRDHVSIVSTDGENWDKYPIGFDATTFNALKVIDGKLVAVGNFRYPTPSTTRHSNLVSDDKGITWHWADTGLPDREKVFDIVDTGTDILAVAQLGQVYRSEDGISFTPEFGRPPWKDRFSSGNPFNAIAQSDSMLVAVGAEVLASNDGETWYEQNPPLWNDDIFNIEAVIWDGQHFLAMGINKSDSDWNTRKVLIATPQGDASVPFDWSIYNPGVEGTVNDMIYANSVYIAVGDRYEGNPDNVWTSIDGINWIERPLPGTFCCAGFELNQVIWTGERFVAVGQYGMFSSADGINWQHDLNDYLDVKWVIYQDGNLLAGSAYSNQYYRSDNGINWSAVNGESYGHDFDKVIWNGLRFLAVEVNESKPENTANYVSQDGYNWERLPSDSVSGGGFDALWHRQQQRFYIVGDNNKIARTADNRPPYIFPVDPVYIMPGQSIDVEVSATDSLDTAITFSGSAFPDGVSISDNGPRSAILQWDGELISPSDPTTITVVASDGELQSEAQVLFYHDTDEDGDGIGDHWDNCISDFNPLQEDVDGDGLGNFCDVQQASLFWPEPITGNQGDPPVNYVNALSGDGKTLVGTATVNGVKWAFKWKARDSSLSVISPTYSEGLVANAVSNNGTYAGGYSLNGSIERTFRYNFLTNELSKFWPSPGQGDIYAFVHAIESVTESDMAVGFSGIPADNSSEPVFWDASITTQGVYMGSVPSGPSTLDRRNTALAITPNGEWAVGESNNQAFIWSRDTGLMESLGIVNASDGYSRANAISADGQTVVGETEGSVFVWDAATGTVKDLYGTRASDLTDDGSIIVGSGQIHHFGDAFSWDSAIFWDSSGSYHTLVAYIEEDLGLDAGDLLLSEIVGISVNATVMAGNARERYSDDVRPWILYLPDSDGDGFGDLVDTDDDGDGISDDDEILAGTNPLDRDSDNDGVRDGDDSFPKDKHYARDSDDDDLPDSWESEHGLNPFSAADRDTDPDQDTRSNHQEFVQYSNPVVFNPRYNHVEDNWDTDSPDFLMHTFTGFNPVVSDDARYLAFASIDRTLVEGDADYDSDVFVFDRQSDSLERISLANDGSEPLSESISPAISGDGQFVAYVSYALNIVPTLPGERGFNQQFVYVKDRNTGVTDTMRPLVTAAISKACHAPFVSSEGRFVVFWATGALLEGDENRGSEVYLWDREQDSLQMISRAVHHLADTTNSSQPRVSDDGDTILFRVEFNDPIEGSVRHLYSYRVTSDHLSLVNELDGGSLLNLPFTGELSGDGSAAVFTTNWDDGMSVKNQVVLADLINNTTEIISLDDAPASVGASYKPTISDNGRWVAFESTAEYLTNDQFVSEKTNVFVFDRNSDETTLLSKNGREQAGLENSWKPMVSGNGRHVYYISLSGNLTRNQEQAPALWMSNRVRYPVSLYVDSTNAAGSELGDVITVRVELFSKFGVPSGTVTVSNSTDSCEFTVTGVSGECQLQSSIEGDIQLIAEYSGDDDFQGAISPAYPLSVTIKPKEELMFGSGFE